jgi:hypothetical protein
LLGNEIEACDLCKENRMWELKMWLSFQLRAKINISVYSITTGPHANAGQPNYHPCSPREAPGFHPPYLTCAYWCRTPPNLEINASYLSFSFLCRASQIKVAHLEFLYWRVPNVKATSHGCNICCYKGRSCFVCRFQVRITCSRLRKQDWKSAVLTRVYTHFPHILTNFLYWSLVPYLIEIHPEIAVLII